MSKLNSIANFFAVVLIMLFLTNVDATQQRTSAPTPERTFIKAEVKGEPGTPQSRFDFTTPKGRHLINSLNGRGRRTGGKAVTRTFSLRLDKSSFIESIQFAEYENDLLIAYQVNYGGSGAGFVTRLDGRTLRMKWKRLIPSFNIGIGLLEDRNAYLTAHGFVAKINLDTGTYAWRHDNLYQDSGAFNSFSVPRVEGNIVAFMDDLYGNASAVTLNINKRNGKIISTNPPIKIVKRKRSPGEYGGEADHE